MLLERELQAKVVKSWKKQGAVCTKNDPPVNAPVGFPDITCYKPDGTVFMAEFKRTENSRYQPLQKEWHDKLKMMGFAVYIIHNNNYKKYIDLDNCYNKEA